MDRVFIEELSVHCVIGVHDWERRVRQKLLISAELIADLRRAAQTDDIAATVDYAAAATAIESIAVEGQFRLIERLAERVAAALLERYPVRSVRVTVRKPGALSRAHGVGVSIERSNDT